MSNSAKYSKLRQCYNFLYSREATEMHHDVQGEKIKATWVTPPQGQGTFWMIGNRFPRLTKGKPLHKMKELLHKIKMLLIQS